MNFLFSHRNFPAQFRHILIELLKDSSNNIVFLTETKNDNYIKGVKKIYYKLKRKVPENSHRYLKQFEEAIIHGQAAAECAIALKNSGFIPDVIYAHGWGNSMFFKDIFPDTPLINYCEWYYNSKGADIGFDGILPDYDKKAKMRCNNAQFLIDLESCDLGICPTLWQKSQFPLIFQDKIKVIHDGIDTDYFKPDKDVEFKIPNSDIKLNCKDEISTYATRGMEQYRGFPEFMQIAKILLQKRPNLSIIIAGEDRVCYGPKLEGTTFKELMLKKLNFNKEELKRIHFTGTLPYEEYRKLLQVSSVHCYLTYPFVLSWSFLEAMSCGCCIAASKTQPVEEVIKDKENGYLTDFYDIKGFIKTINKILDAKAINNGFHSDENLKIKENVRKTIIENYDLKKLLPEHIEIIKEIVKQ